MLLMQEYEQVWISRQGSEPVELFGFRFDVGLDPIQVDLERMINAFRRGCQELGEIWSIALQTDNYADVRKLGCESRPGDAFHMEDELWTRVILDFACAHKKQVVDPEHLLKSLTPLYLARVASFVMETRDLVSSQVEQKIEQLCLCFENNKPYLEHYWSRENGPSMDEAVRAATPAPRDVPKANLEV